jgi:archaellum component FlaC
MYANMRGLKKVFDWREWQDNTTNKSSRVALICSMIVLTFGAIGNSQSSNTLPRRPSNTPTSSSNAHSPAPSVSAVSASPTYQIPSYISQELDKDKKAIESEREKASALENQLTKAKTAVEAQKAKTDETESRLETLDRQIEADRIYLDRASQSDVDDFNDKVKRYNAMLETARQQNALANQMVDDYNTLLDQVRTETRLLNQMVDNYNAKLTKYGR